MAEFNTKYFGKIIVSTDDDGGEADVTYNNQDIHISVDKDFVSGDKVNIFKEILDNYIEINEIAKKAIINNFPKSETVKSFFKCNFNISEKNNQLKHIVKELKYPNINLYIYENEICIVIIYIVPADGYDEILEIEMDEKLNIKSFYNDRSDD